MSRRLYLLMLAFVFTVASASAADRIRVLIVDGQSNHDWKSTSAILKSELLSSGKFTVDIATTPPAGADAEAWKTFTPDFAGHDVTLLNYYGRDWPEPVISALESYVQNGGGLAAFHAGGSSFEDRPSYNRMIGLAWRKKDFGVALAMGKNGKLVRLEKGTGPDSNHGAKDPFMVVTRAPDHPIMRGFPASWEHLADELYYGLRGPGENMDILATAHSPITGLDEPMAWTVKCGRGRVFYTAMGHDTTAIECLGFQNLMARGLEWAATGTVASPRLLKPFAETIKAHIDPTVKVTGPYAVIRLPITEGIKLHNPTRVAVGPGGKIYAANYSGEIVRLEDTDGDGLEDTAVLYADIKKDGKQYLNEDAKNYPGVPQGPGLRYPTGLTFKGNDCYVGTTQEIRVYTDTKGTGVADTSRTFATGWPYTMQYFDWTFGMRFGPDGCLYANLTTDYLNDHPASDPQGLRGSMIRISPDGKSFQRFAYGLRFAYGIAFNEAGDLFSTDNEGGGNPAEKLSYITKGGNYGHHPKLATGPKIPPVVWITAHMSTDGMDFNPSTNDFGGTAGDCFIALWGPDGQYDKGGITRVRLTKKPDGTYDGQETRFSEGPAKMIDLCFGPQGDLYGARFGHDGPHHIIFDPAEGDIYRIIYTPGYNWNTSGPAVVTNPLKDMVTGSPIKGLSIFQSRQCITCHTVDGSASKLGPDLKSVWETFGRAGVLKILLNPNAASASGYDTVQVETLAGESIVGRMLASDESQVTMMVPGNTQRTIPRGKIKSVDMLPVSMMPPGLTAGLSDTDLSDLFSYLRSVGSSGTSTPVIYLKAGGTSVTDATGVKWEAEAPYKQGLYGYDGGTVYSDNAIPDPLLKTCRFGNLQYRFDIDPGDYDVTVVTSETYYHNAGQRIFSISANGQNVVKDIDPFAEAGFAKPIRKTFRAHVKNGPLTLNLTGTRQEPVVNAIEVRAAPSNSAN